MSVLRFPDESDNPAEVGGKAAALASLSRNGFAPPAFFTLLPSAFSWEAAGPVAHADLQQALDGALTRIGAGPYAVRSSGRSEDGAEHSHAGQFESFLNVGAGDVLEAAKKVWLSGFSESVETYRAKTTGAGAEAPGIIVQRMIDARAAGVAFSADPMTGKRGRVIISAVAGLADQLVSGEVDGEDWVVEVSGAIVAPPQPMVLAEEDAQKIAQLARRVEESFGLPQDIEWAIDEDGLHVLQARPITTRLLPEPQPDETLTIFDNSNIVESYPGVVSPLTYTFAVHVYARVYRAFLKMLGVSDRAIAKNAPVFDNMLSRVDGRVYYNLLNWYRTLALVPGFSLNRDHMETMMGVSTPMPREITDAIGPAPARGGRRFLEYVRLARVGLGLFWQALRLSRTRTDFYSRLNAALNSDLDLATANLNQLAGEYRRIETTLLDRWDAPLVNDFLCMMAFGASRKLLGHRLGERGLQLHNDVMIGQGDIVSAEPAQRILAIGAMVRDAGLSAQLSAETLDAFEDHPEIRMAVESYLEKFGDRCVEELKLESIPLKDDPKSLLLAIGASARRDEISHVTLENPDWAKLFPASPAKRLLVKLLIGWTKARVRDRENLRFQRTRIFGHARRVFLAMGREFTARDLLASDRDVLYLTKAEILGAIEGSGLSADLKGIAAKRKTEDAASAQRPDPPERIEVRGPAIGPVWTDATPGENGEKTKTGVGCSAGDVEARARVITDPRTQHLETGEILVARHTDPGWIAVFSGASAIVVERGSLLSHSAIVARELGIPCVVGLSGATQWIADGETLRVNGATGVVERVDAAQ